ncbi:MAG: hypothetical protein DSY76_04160 [Bacteroidetes bacterium]|nr:MAG: hypothetical protein DSY76_04160 [Bacteroidota bacterium]
MKKIKLIFGSLAVVAMLATVACNKDEETTPTPPDDEQTEGSVVVNELMSKDTLGLVYTDAQGDFCDWSEFYNPGDEDINIGGYFIGDDGEATADKDKYEIPDDNAKATTIKAKGYLVIVWGAADAAGNDVEGIINDTIFCPSSLSAKKDKAVAIWDKSGKFIGESEDFTANGPLGKLPDGKSMARESDGSKTWKICDTPTPGAENK